MKIKKLIGLLALTSSIFLTSCGVGPAVKELKKVNDETARYWIQFIKENGINYSRCERSNIFVVDCPDEQTCKDFQLSSFTVDENGELKTKAHFIIFPHHTEEMMIKAVNRLKK